MESGQTDAARPFLIQARDHDVCPLRAPTYLTTIVEEVARKRQVPLVDAEQLFLAKSASGIVGNDWLVDHIHPSVEGHQMLAVELAKTCSDAGIVTFSESHWEELARSAFQDRLATLGEDYFQRGKQRLEGLLLWTQGRAKKVRPDGF